MAAETMEVIDKDGVHDCRTTQSTYDHRESAFLFQRLSVLIQRYYSVAVLGTFTHTTTEDEM